MAAPSNENQGLKIAVACFVMLSVILAVSTYFGFKNYLETDKKLETANAEVASEKKEQGRLTAVLNEFKDAVGLNKTEQDDLPKAAKKQVEELTKKAVEVRDLSAKALDEYKSAGGAQAKLEEARQSLDQIIAAVNDPSRTVLSVSERLTELMKNQALISSMLAAEFDTTRSELEDANKINQSKLDVEVAARTTTKQDAEAEITKHENDRQALAAKVGALQETSNQQATEIIKYKNQIAQMKDDFDKQRDDLLVTLRDLRDRAERKENVLDQKDGTITFVEHGRGEVRTDLKRSQGAREQMVLSIFDRKSPGLPTDQPKATIELIQVDDRGSLARIIKTENSVDPIRVGDQVYSAAWNPNEPAQFALIGKMDVNRDGRDDRADLKRMIEKAGGKVVYDLPPSNVGRESGKLSPLIAWYVIDQREPFYPPTTREGAPVSTDEQNFLTKRTEAIKTARLDGIRPISIERLLSQLGYSYGTVVPGRVEAGDRTAADRILNPKGKVGTISPDPSPETETPAGEDPK